MMTIAPAQAAAHVAVLLTCFNRRELTLKSLRSLRSAAGDHTVRIVLVDDGSTDGTSAAVQREFPCATVARGDGSLFWNRGMRRAWETALPLAPDYFLWLNDDTVLRPDAIADLIELQRRSGPKAIAIGCTVDPESGEVTYGGYRHREGAMSRLSFRRARRDELDCDTMNGNCVLFPAKAVEHIGINSSHYSHAFGDNDYGLRACRAGYRIVQLSNPVAIQENNEQYHISTSTLTLANWRHILLHPKGVPYREWLHFCREHGGLLWPINFLGRYGTMIVAGIRRQLGRPI